MAPSRATSKGVEGKESKDSKVSSMAVVARKSRPFRIDKTSSLRDIFGLQSVIHVKVGPSKEDFGVHKEPLCQVSAFFKAALNGSFAEAKSRVVVLDDEDPGVFAHFVGWLYTGGIIIEEESQDSGILPFLGPFIDLYQFAEKRIIPTLQNEIIDAFIYLFDTKNESFGMLEIRRIWETTTASSKLRTFAIDHHVRSTNSSLDFDALGESDKDCPPQFLVAVAKAYHDIINAPRATTDPGDPLFYKKLKFWKNRCVRYHVHEPNDGKCLT